MTTKTIINIVAAITALGLWGYLWWNTKQEEVRNQEWNKWVNTMMAISKELDEYLLLASKNICNIQLTNEDKQMNIELTQEQKDLVIAEWQEAQTKQVVKPKRWRAKGNEQYFYIDMDGDIEFLKDTKSNVHNTAYQIGNYFQTEQQAETYKKHLILLQKLKDEIAELNDDWVADWIDIDQDKYSLYYNHRTDNFTCDNRSIIQHLPNTLYGTEQTMDRVISTWSKEDLYLAMFGEEL